MKRILLLLALLVFAPGGSPPAFGATDETGIEGTRRISDTSDESGSGSRQERAAIDPDGPTDDPSSAVFSVDTPIGPLEYRSARGLSVGDTGLNIGGFTNVEFDKANGEPFEIQLDSVNFLVLYEPIDAFRVFAELEVGDLVSYEARGNTESDVSFQIERLYGELSLDDPLNLRFGKFQTPIGRWNLVPAEPFVWTASDPVIIDTAFDEHQTGLALTGSFFPSAGTLDYWIYGQMIDPLDAGDTPPPTSRSVGGRVQFTKSLEGWSIGSSFLASRRKGEWSYLGGLDAEVRFGDLEFLSELVYEEGAIGGRDLFGTFLQGRYEFFGGLSLVARYEYFNRIGTSHDDAHIGDFGFAWQPRPWLIVKSTYRFSSRETDDVQRGLSSSISLVF